MIIPKKNKILVYNNIFSEGVIAVADNAMLPKHCDLDLPNLQVMKLCQSLCSRGYLKKRYSWRWYYYFLTNEGLAYMRDYLGNLPEEVVPKTHVQTAQRAPTSRPLGSDRREGSGRGRFGDRGDRGGDRDGYRRFEKKEGGAPEGFQPEFRGSGRGRAPQETQQ